MARAYLVPMGLFILPGVAAKASDAATTSPSLVLVGDMQRSGFWEHLFLGEQNDTVRTDIMREIAAENPQLVVILGDLVSSGGDQDAWRQFDRFTAPLSSRSIRVVPIMGNHEYFGDRATMRSAVSSRFPSLGEKTWNVVRSQGIAVILLDSNFGKLTKDEIRRQREWYLDQLASLDKDPAVQFIVVCCHNPPYTNSTIVWPSPEVERAFVPPFLESAKAVLFASGHSHSYEHFRHEGKDFIVTGGGGGPRHRLATAAGRRPFEDVYDGPAFREFNFCTVAPEADHLRVSMVCPSGEGGKWRACDEFRVARPIH